MKKEEELGERVTRVEESAKSAHKRLDTFEAKGGKQKWKLQR